MYAIVFAQGQLYTDLTGKFPVQSSKGNSYVMVCYVYHCNKVKVIRLLPQVEITLNLLQTSRLHPQLSATAHFHGLVDYNKTAFSPPGCKIIAHEKPGKRRTWAPPGKHGYSLGPAMHHYQCQNVYISSTASERTVDTIEFFPHNY
jgi:hypothetical protein